MSEYNSRDLINFSESWRENNQYFDMLALMASLSRLFSENDVPYLDYRLTENLFCKYYRAINDARQCTAYDARLSCLGVGIKTFILKNGESIEKVAEFNKLRPQLNNLHGVDLARKIAEFRNERIRFSNDSFAITDSIYHVVGRDTGLLRIFNLPYDLIDIERISHVRDSEKTIKFDDGINTYSFNKSKSVLMKRFVLPPIYKDVPVDILEDPLSILEGLLRNGNIVDSIAHRSVKGVDYVVLPLYSTRTGEVPEKSGLNQWNAGGRKRDDNEVYIPVPIAIHKDYPLFFPSRDMPFELSLPDGTVLSAKICQENGKALMSNPNSALGEWLLRKILKKLPGELVTKFDLDVLGIDSVIITKKHSTNLETGRQEFAISFFDEHEDYNSFLG